MTREEAEALLEQMDKFAVYLFYKGLVGANASLVDAIELIDSVLEDKEVFSE